MNGIEMLSFITMIVAFVMGYLSKKSKFISNNLIPIQNLLIGFIVAIINFLITKDFSTAVALSGLFAGGVYDIYYNLKKIFHKEAKDE